MTSLRQARALLTPTLLFAVAALALLGLAPAAHGQTDIFKTNSDTTGLQLPAAWSNLTGGAGGTPLGVNITDEGIIDSTVAAANTSLTYSANLTLGALKIENPGGTITINGTTNVPATDTFFLGNSAFANGGGIDMSNATQNLILGANVSLALQDAQTWTIGNGTSHPTLTVNSALNDGISLSVNGTGAVTFAGVISGNGPIYLDSSNSTTFSANNTVTGGIILENGTLVLGSNGNATAGPLGAAGNTLTVAGGASGVSINDTGTTTLATNNNLALFSNVTFINAGGSLNLGSDFVGLGVGNVVLTLTANTVTMGGTISDGGTVGSPVLNYSNGNSLTENGSGNLDLTGTNTFSGNFNLQSGTLTLGNSTALQNATLNYTGGTVAYSAGITNITVAGLAGTTNLTLPSANLTIATGPFSNGNYSGNLSGTGSKLIISGNGTQTLSGANTFTGGVTLNGATLNIDNANALGTVAGTFTILGGTIDNMNATLTTTANYPLALNGSFTFAGSNNLNLGTGAVTLNTSPTITVSGNILTIGGTISGAQGLTLDGPGTLALTNISSNYTGVTTINGGTLQVSNLTAGGSSSSIGNSSVAAANLIINGGTLQLIATATQATNRNFEVGPGGATLDNSGSGSLSFNSTSNLTFNGVGFDPVLTFTGSNATATTNTFSGNIIDNGSNTTSVIKNGSNEWELNGTGSTYSGGTTLNSGTLLIGAAGALGTGALTITGGNLNVTGGLSVTNAQNFDGNWTFVGSNTLTLGNSTDGTTLGTNVTLTVTASTLTIGGNISDGGNGYSLTKAGAGDLALNGTDTFSGNLNMTAGTLTLGANLALQNATLNFTGGTVTYSAGITNVTVGGLAGNQSLTLPTGNLNINTSNVVSANEINAGENSSVAFSFANLTYNGVISGGGNVVMSGNGTEVFSGNNTYTGGTTINSGTLDINANGTSASNSAIGTGTLTLSGTWVQLANGSISMTGGNLDNSSGGNVALGTNNAITLDSHTAELANSTSLSLGGFYFAGTDNLNLGTGAVTLSGSNAIFQIVVAGSTLTIGGAISGTGDSIVLLGSQTAAFGGGTLVLSGANTYTGGTTIEAGWLDINSNTAIGTGQLVLDGGNIDNTSGSAKTLTNNNAQVWEANFTFGGSNNLNLGTGTVSLGATPVITITGNTLTVGGNITDISGSFGLTLNGQGTLSLTGGADTNYTGATTINGGTLSVTTLANGLSNSSIGSSSAAAFNLIINGGTLQYVGTAATSTNRTFEIGPGGATLDNSGSGALSFTNTTSNMTFTTAGFDPVLTFTDSNATATTNTFSGNIINNGSNPTSVIKNGSNEWVLNGTGSNYSGGTTLNAGTLGIGSANALGTGTLIINGGNLDATAAGLSANIAQNWNGNWAFVGTNSLTLGNSTEGTTLGANVTLNVSASTLTIGGQISDGGAGYTLTKAGTGTLVLSNNLSLQDSTLAFNTGFGVVTFGQNNATIGGLSGSGNLVAPTANLTLNTGFFFNNNYSGNLSGPTNVTVSGAGVQEFSGTSTYTGTTNITGGTLEIGSTAALGTSALTIDGGNLAAAGETITNSMTLKSNFTFVGTGALTDSTGAVTLDQSEVVTVAASTLTLGGVISGSGFSLTKAGAGTLVLSGVNTYSGGTIVSGGALDLNFTAANNTAAQTITSNNTALTLKGGALAVTGVAGAANINTETFSATTIGAGASSLSETMATGTMTVNLGTLSRSAGGTFNLSATNTTNIITTSTSTTTSGVITNGGVAFLTVNGTNWGNYSTGNIIAATSTVTANTGWASTINELLTSSTTFKMDTATATSKLNTLVFNGTADTLNLNGGTLTMTTGGILQSGNATGADTISNGSLTAANGELVLIVNNATAADGLTISGNIVGAIAVTKSGLGNLSLTGTASNYTGATYLDQGTITLGSATALGTGTLNINGGTLNVGSALTVTNAQDWNANWTFTGTNTLTLGNSTDGTTLGANVVLTNSASTLTIAGNITGAFSLTETGGGTLAINGTSNTYSGGLILGTSTTVSGGTIDINSATALGTGTFVINNGTLDNKSAGLITNSNNNAQIWNNGFTYTGSTESLNLGTGNVALGANDTITVSGNTLTVGGNIGGSTTATTPSQFGLTKAGAGTLVLSGNNDYNGGTTLSVGTLVLGNGTSTSGYNTGTGNITANAGTLYINQGGNSTASSLGTGTLVLGNGTSTATLDNNSTATQTIGTNNAILVNNSFTYIGATQSLNLGTGNVTLGVTPTITVSGNTLTLGGVVSGAFGLTKAGAGDLVLAGNNAYSGATLVSAGTLELSANNALGVNALGTTVSSGATLQLDNNYQTGSGNSSSTGSLLTLSGVGNGSANGGALLNAANANSNWDGNIALAGNATISSGAGTSGILTLGNGTALSSTSLWGNISNISIGNNTLTFTGAAGTETFINSNITGNQGNVIVNTGGTVEYNAATNSYTGLTTIQNGTLLLNTNPNSANISAGESNFAFGGNLAILGNIVIGATTGTANTAILEIATDVDRPINYQSTVLINETGEFNTNSNPQTISNLTMNGGYITTGTGGLLALNGNSSITILGNGNSNGTSLINGNFSIGGSDGATLTPINVTGNAARQGTLVNGVGSDFNINATLTGGSFILTGNGITSLTNQQVGATVQNTFTGSAEIQGGTLVITASNALGAANNQASEGTQVDAGAQLQLNQTAGNLAIAVPNELLTLNGQGTTGANGTTVSDGALLNVNGTNSWAGSVIVNSSATVNTAGSSSLTFAPTNGGTGTYSSNISSTTGATLTFNGTGNTTISTPIAGATNNLNLYANMNGTSTLLISNTTTNNTYTGTTTVNNGTLELNGNTTAGGTTLVSSNTLTINTHGTLLTDTNNTLGSNTNMTLNGGTWETNAANPGGTGLTAFSSNTGTTAQTTFAQQLNTLTLTANSNLTLGSGSNIINFAASNGTNWTPGQVLYINDWNGTFATSISANDTDGLNGGGGQDQIIFGSDNTGLDGSAYTGQLGEIIFVNPQDAALGFTGATGDFDAVITADGEVVPFVTVPEPGTLAAGAALGALALLGEWRRRKNRAAQNIVS